jgi:RNA polymerase subunit RPABC4/transcription elongation factor Spt4
MALKKCSECGGEVSDKATECPHCGNPIVTGAVLIPKPTSEIAKPQKRSFSIKRILFALFICIAVLIIIWGFGLGFISQATRTNQNGGLHFVNTMGQPITPQLQPTTDSLVVQTTSAGTFYPLQQVNLWGYSFYTSKIDGSESIDIGSSAKQTIAELLSQLGYPHPMTTNLAIIDADPTLMQPGEYIQTPWAGNVPVPISTFPENGLYGQVGDGAIIFMNSSNNWDLAVLTHELGHQIGFHMTDAEWTQYYELRGIPANTPRQTTDWYTSPEEDFAEVFKATYAQGSGGEWDIRTNYGMLISTNNMYDSVSPCYQIEQTALQNSLNTWEQNNSTFIVPTEVMTQLQDQAQYDPKVQTCRQTDTTQSPFGGALYERVAGPATQQFVKSVVARLSKTPE